MNLDDMSYNELKKYAILGFNMVQTATRFIEDEKPKRKARTKKVKEPQKQVLGKGLKGSSGNLEDRIPPGPGVDQ